MTETVEEKDAIVVITEEEIVTIEDNVEIGANTCVDRSTMGSTYVRKGVKLDNLIQIAHNTDIGENTVMSAQVGIAGSTKVGQWCMFGGQVGLAWMMAALLFLYTGKRTQWATAFGILVGYFVLLRCCIAPDAPAGAGHFSLEGNIVSYIDRLLIPNHLLKPGVYDPEGILSTFPAVVTALLGMFTGRYVKESSDSGNTKTLKMLCAAVAMAVIAVVWNHWFPVNKKLWTSTFVLAAGAWSVGIFALFYYLIDVRGWRKGVLFFQVVGMNSITIYMFQRIVDVTGISKFFLGGVAGLLPEAWGSLLVQLGYFAVCWLFLYFLYRKNCFLKV